MWARHKCVTCFIQIHILWLIHMCDMTRSYVWHDSFICVTWLICVMNVWRVSFKCIYVRTSQMCGVIHSNMYTWAHHKCGVLSYIYELTLRGTWTRPKYVTWFIQMCDVIYSNVWRNLFKCVTWYIQMCDTIHSKVWRDLFKCETWFIQICDVDLVYVWRDSCIFVAMLSFTRVTWHMHMCDVTSSMCDVFR